jgi:hypothetical protein
LAAIALEYPYVRLASQCTRDLDRIPYRQIDLLIIIDQLDGSPEGVAALYNTVFSQEKGGKEWGLSGSITSSIRVSAKATLE